MGKVVRGVEQVVAPVPPQPAHVLEDGVDVLDLLAGGVGIIKAHVAVSAVFGGEAEIEAGGLGVPDVQIPVGFRREPGDNVAAELAGLVVVGDYGADEVMPGGVGFSRLRHSLSYSDPYVGAHSRAP